jgi:phosphoglycolate phosphatase-like HAD superfamily hydrolase
MKITEAVRAALEAARAQRDEARAKFEATTKSVESAQRIESEAQQELAAARRVEEDATNAHARKLEHAIVAGIQKMPPSIIVDTHARQSADTRLAIASKALRALTEQHTQALTALRAADAAVARAADDILNAEAEGLVADIDSTYAELLHLGELLRGYLPSGAVSLGYSPPPNIARALALVPTQNWMHVPIHQLRAGAQPADFAAVAARRAALISGDSVAA